MGGLDRLHSVHHVFLCQRACLAQKQTKKGRDEGAVTTQNTQSNLLSHLFYHQLLLYLLPVQVFFGKCRSQLWKKTRRDNVTSTQRFNALFKKSHTYSLNTQVEGQSDAIKKFSAMFLCLFACIHWWKSACHASIKLTSRHGGKTYWWVPASPWWPRGPDAPPPAPPSLDSLDTPLPPPRHRCHKQKQVMLRP